MKIYLAANFRARVFLKKLIPLFEDKGHEITSRWITHEDHVAETVETKVKSAKEDVEDVYRAEAIVLFADQYGPRPARGKYVELGLALAKKKKIYIVGQERDCIFYWLPEVQWFKNEVDLLEVI